jgi:hypothetical protein
MAGSERGIMSGAPCEEDLIAQYQTTRVRMWNSYKRIFVITRTNVVTLDPSNFKYAAHGSLEHCVRKSTHARLHNSGIRTCMRHKHTWILPTHNTHIYTPNTHTCVHACMCTTYVHIRTQLPQHIRTHVRPPIYTYYIMKLICQSVHVLVRRTAGEFAEAWHRESQTHSPRDLYTV